MQENIINLYIIILADYVFVTYSLIMFFPFKSNFCVFKFEKCHWQFSANPSSLIRGDDLVLSLDFSDKTKHLRDFHLFGHHRRQPVTLNDHLPILIFLRATMNL